MLVGLFSSLGDCGNIVANGSFEGRWSTAPAGWKTNVISGKHTFSDSREPHSGSRCVAINSEQAGCGRWYNTSTYLLEGVKYRFSAWVRTVGNGVNGQIFFHPASAGVSFVFANTPQWRLYTHEFTAAGTERAGIYLQSLGIGTVIYDDISIEPLEYPKLDGNDTISCQTGLPIVGIVISGVIEEHEFYLASDVRRVLQQMTGKTIPVVKLGSENPTNGRWLYIGCAPRVDRFKGDLKTVGSEGIVIDITSNTVVCIGNTPRGDYYAVQELFYQLGCRWYTPFDGGECIPRNTKLPLPVRRIVHRPSFELRGGKTVHLYNIPPDMQMEHVDVDRWADWTARNHMNCLKGAYLDPWEYGAIRGGEWSEYTGHTLYALLPPSKYFAEHPEYYPLVQGKRTSTHSSGRPAQVCVSNPDVPRIIADRVIAFFDDNPGFQRVSVCAEDEPSYWCECTNCRALDTDPNIDWSKNGVDLDWSKSGAENYKASMTDRWLYLVNQVADIVAKRYPDKWVVTYAYASTVRPPVKYFPHKNVMIEQTWYDRCFKHKLGDITCSVNVEKMKEFKEWANLANMCTYTYLDFMYTEAPGPYYHSEVDFLRTMRKNGVRYVADEWSTTHMASPLLLNLRTRLLWDVNTDVDKYIDQFCRIVYGPAAEPVKRYFQVLEQSVTKAKTEHVAVNDIDKFTPGVLAGCHVLLSDADIMAGSDDVLKARIARLRVTVLYAELYRALNQGSIASENVIRLRKEINELIQQYKLPVNLYGYGVLGSS